MIHVKIRLNATVAVRLLTIDALHIALLDPTYLSTQPIFVFVLALYPSANAWSAKVVASTLHQ
jgi:hypothetical protein